MESIGNLPRCPLKNKIAEGAESTLSVPCRTAFRQSLSFPWMLFLPFLLFLHGSLMDDCISLRFPACVIIVLWKCTTFFPAFFLYPSSYTSGSLEPSFGCFLRRENSIFSSRCCLLSPLFGVREEVGHSFPSLWLFRCMRNTHGSTTKRDEQDNPRSTPIFPHSVVNLLIKIKTVFFSSVKHVLGGLLLSLVTSSFPQRRNLSSY